MMKKLLFYHLTIRIFDHIAEKIITHEISYRYQPKSRKQMRKRIKLMYFVHYLPHLIMKDDQVNSMLRLIKDREGTLTREK